MIGLSATDVAPRSGAVVLTNPQRHTGGVSSWTTTGTRAAEATAGIAAPCSGITRLFSEVSGETAKAEAGWRTERNPGRTFSFLYFSDLEHRVII